MTIQPYTVHEAEVAVFHAWGDGLPVDGPLSRGLLVPVADEFRSGLKIGQVGGGAGLSGDFGEWRLNRPQAVMGGEWMVEFTAPLGAPRDEVGVNLGSFLLPGMPVVVVVRFQCRETGVWRVFQFHDCVVLAGDAGDEGQWMVQGAKFSAGHMEEYKSGAIPALVPRLRGVIEWRHLGRRVRCWEYDAGTNTFAEEAENSEVVGGDVVRYVNLDFSGDGVGLSYLAASLVDVTSGGVAAKAVGWADAAAFSVTESSGLTFEPGVEMEAEGCAEPLLLPVSGRQWEAPRVVFRFLGRVYATLEAGVLALPDFTVGAPVAPMDFPLRLGRLLLYPAGGWLLPATDVPSGAMLAGDGTPMVNAGGAFMLS